MFHYLQKHGLDPADFTRFAGESVLPSWKRRGDTVADMMNGVLHNVLANGGSVVAVTIGEQQAEATVSSLLRLDVMERYGIPAAQAERFWDRFIPIGQALGIRFTRTALGDGRNQIVLERMRIDGHALSMEGRRRL
jgi:hypothetical protein